MSRRDRYEPVAAEPTVLGRFTELRKVGMGGMGIVYAAHDPMLDRKVALKLLRPHRNAPEDSIRMIREAQAMARLIHPNVVAVHDVGIIDGCVFLAMDYIEGQTFRQLDLDPAQWRRIIELYLQAGQGLAAAHEAQLVHRDFKPESGRFSFRTPSSRETPRISSLEGVGAKIGCSGLTLLAPG